MELWHRRNSIFQDFLKIEENTTEMAGGKTGVHGENRKPVYPIFL
jgi:hypothetical protein